MFLDLTNISGSGELNEGTITERLAAAVTTVFPTLRTECWRLDRSGGDHLLLISDTCVFRFPRAGMHDLTLEIAVLRSLRGRTAVPIPRYDHVDPQGRFAGYPYLAGVALTPDRFAALSRARQDHVLEAAASFLSELHRVVPDPIAPREDWPLAWTATRFAERGMTERLAIITRAMPAYQKSIEAFYAGYREDHAPRPVVIHGDLVAEHILLDEQTARLCGIIDFGDVALGDPAQDFMGLWAYGADAARRAVQLYRPLSPDPGLLARSRNHFIRYRLDCLFEGLRNGINTDQAQAGGEIAALLSASDALPFEHTQRK